MRKHKILAITICLVLAIAVFTGCSVPEITRPMVSAGAKMVTVSGSCKATIENGKIIVTAQTDIMDGTIFKLSIQTVEGKELAQQTITKQGDNLKAEFDVSVLEGEKEFYAFASCAAQAYGAQPENVLNTYGQQFELMQGEDVLWDLAGVVAVFNSGKVSVE